MNGTIGSSGNWRGAPHGRPGVMTQTSGRGEHGPFTALVIEGLVRRPHRCQPRPIPLQLRWGRLPPHHVEDLAANLNPRIRLGSKVENPRVGSLKPRVHVADDQASTIAEVKKGHSPPAAGTASDRRQQKHRSAAGERESPASPAVQLTLQRRDHTSDREHPPSSASQPTGVLDDGATDRDRPHRSRIVGTRQGSQGQTSHIPGGPIPDLSITTRPAQQNR